MCANYITEQNVSTLFGVGVSAFVGVEYFFAPKMSIGGEFGWGLGLNQGSGVSGNGETVSEAWSSNSKSVNTTTIETGGKVSSFIIDTKSTGGQIFLLFHF